MPEETFERGPTDDELEARLGEPLVAYSLAMPVGAWTPGVFASLRRAFKPSREEGSVKLGTYNLIALTATRLVCFTATFDRKRGLAPKDQVVDWPRGDIQGSATNEESTTATIYGRGDVGPNKTQRIVRLTLRAGGQALQADLNGDDRTAALLDALAVEPA